MNPEILRMLAAQGVSPQIAQSIARRQHPQARVPGQPPTLAQAQPAQQAPAAQTPGQGPLNATMAAALGGRIAGGAPSPGPAPAQAPAPGAAVDPAGRAQMTRALAAGGIPQKVAQDFMRRRMGGAQSPAPAASPQFAGMPGKVARGRY